MKKFTGVYGDGQTKKIIFQHNLDTTAVAVSVRNEQGRFYEPDILIVDSNTIQLAHAITPGADDVHVTVIG